MDNTEPVPMMHIKFVPAFNDNYIWLLITSNQHCVCVDPGEAEPVLDVIDRESLQLDAIFITHHHPDHTGGIAGLKAHFDVPVYGPINEQIPHCQHPVSSVDRIVLNGYPQFTVLDIPGHTRGHIAYYAPGMLFSGDTLFSAGCGRLFEGTAEQMYQSIEQLRQLPDTTWIYCGHEYTQNNLRFAQLVEPNNSAIRERYRVVADRRKQQKATVPTLLADERLINPFLRIAVTEVQEAIRNQTQRNTRDPVALFAALRQWKDSCA